MKIEITLTRDDMIDWKKNTPINEIDLVTCFDRKVITMNDILKAHTIVFIDGDEIITLKSRD